jgi:hypothetical protein
MWDYEGRIHETPPCELSGHGSKNKCATLAAVTSSNYPSDFRWWWPASNIAQWPGIRDILGVVNGVTGLDVQEFDLGLAPWPCHGILFFADARDIMTNRAPEGFVAIIRIILPQLQSIGFWGTCGGVSTQA